MTRALSPASGRISATLALLIAACSALPSSRPEQPLARLAYQPIGREIVEGDVLVVRGVLQEEQGVLNVRARTFAAPLAEAGTAHARSHDFR